ncbi:MAG: hypothetical protein ACON39_03880 [Coraliomargaritaceae bacterium]
MKKNRISRYTIKRLKSASKFLAGYSKTSCKSAKGMISDLTEGIQFKSKHVRELKGVIHWQRIKYQKLIRSRKALDYLMLGGESIITLKAATHIPEAIQKAYEAALPQVSSQLSLQEKLSQAEGDELIGLLALIKGKLFEQKYVDYLNNGNLEEGYTAILANSPTQKGWDIAIMGPNDEVTQLIQAKATDSVGYVLNALKENPHIDVVTTSGVYSHLVLSGGGNMIHNSGISNVALDTALVGAVESTNIKFGFAPPWFTLALIAFTTYKAEDLNLYQKAQSAGDRSAKAYLSYLIGGTLAAATNIWWTGVLATIASRYIADKGNKRRALYNKLKQLIEKNSQIIDVMADEINPARP